VTATPIAGEDELVRDHLHVVDQVVASFRTRLPAHVAADDVRSAAHLGLLAAARSYDADRGVPFAAYATTRMRGAVLDELRRVDWVSRRVRAKARSLQEATDAGRTADEAATAAGMSRAEADRVLLDVRRGSVVSVEECLDERPGVLPSAERTPESHLLQREAQGYLRDAIATLPERLRHVVVMTFLEEQPLSAVAAQLGVTESRVSHMRAEAVSLLRQAMTQVLADGEPPPPTSRSVAARRRIAYCEAVASASHYRDRLRPTGLAVAV
jgi:RNA polymerase sigma factor for flagellar operon FliA